MIILYVFFEFDIISNFVNNLDKATKVNDEFVGPANYTVLVGGIPMNVPDTALRNEF